MFDVKQIWKLLKAKEVNDYVNKQCSPQLQYVPFGWHEKDVKYIIFFWVIWFRKI